jgi:cytoskeleton protein RodZ
MMNPMENPLQPTVGTLLKNRRQDLGLSLAEVAERTHIRRAYLEALEADHFEALPGDAYKSGFLRNYAGTLGLEPGSVLRQWREQTVKASDGRFAEPSAVPPVLTAFTPSGRSRRRSVLLLLLPLLLVVASALYFSVEKRNGAEAHVPVPVTAAPIPAPSALALPQPVDLIVQSPPVDEILPSPASASEASTGLAEKPAAPAALPAIPDGGSVIRFEALGPLTVEVTVDSRPLQRYVLTTSSALQWNVGSRARLAVDNPAAARVWLGGEPLDLAGRSEIVLQALIPE